MLESGKYMGNGASPLLMLATTNLVSPDVSEH